MLIEKITMICLSLIQLTRKPIAYIQVHSWSKFILALEMYSNYMKLHVSYSFLLVMAVIALRCQRKEETVLPLFTDAGHLLFIVALVAVGGLHQEIQRKWKT